ncbi:MAG TPA: glutamine synthetase family protein [Chloroflexota bacterium]|nr:glutamine synthetase family protein [Chloroflexota bacterium]
MVRSIDWLQPSEPSPNAINAVISAARSANVEFVHLQFTDIPGGLKSLSIPIGRLADSLATGVWFDGSSVEGLARIAESDLYLRPDPATFAVMPWERPTTARIVCDLVTPDGQPFLADPRFVLKRSMAAAAEKGLDYRVGAEVEFYLFEEPTASQNGTKHGVKPADTRSYFELAGGRAATVCQEAVRALQSFGYRVTSTHHEVSPGQFEIDLAADDALRTADAIVALKLVLRILASRAGLLPTFMPKPREDSSGSGVHLEQELRDQSHSQNTLVDATAEYQLSPMTQHFVAGQLAHARGMCAVLAPLVNSYKRLIGGDEAPSRVSWAHLNRGAFIRIPLIAADTGLVEVRAADPSCNPYLALAVLLASGLDGIDNQTPLPAPDDQDHGEDASIVYATTDLLPSTLGEALEELEWDMVVRSTLGQPVFERLLAEKEREWLAYRHHISDWEIDSYLERA